MNESERLAKDLEAKEDQIRIALSVGIIAAVTFFIKVFQVLGRLTGSKNDSLFTYIIHVPLNFIFQYVCGIVIIFLFLYIICLTSKYTYKKNLVPISEKFIKFLYDSGIICFWFTFLFTTYISFIFISNFITRKYFPHLGKANVLGQGIAAFFYIVLLVIIKKRKMFKNLIQRILIKMKALKRLIFFNKENPLK